MEKKKLSKKANYKKLLAGIITAASVLSLTLFNASAYNADRLIPVGDTIGISMMFEGAVVVSVTTTENGCSPAGDAGIKAGDIIISINGVRIRSSVDVKNVSAEYTGKPIEVKYTRSGNECTATVTPRLNDEGNYELGVWLRDSMTGLGTMTFYDPNTGTFGALGHGISDMENNELIPLRTGEITETDKPDVVVGKAGIPGQLRGKIDLQRQIGKIIQNTGCGIFGLLDVKGCKDMAEAIPIANDNEIFVGKACILCNVDGSVKEYEIEISRLYLGDSTSKKNLLVTVTDEKLLSITGGIVQGMSGSPIIQNGKFVGAVTHVLINNPAKGYGITICNMLSAMESLENAA